MRRNLLWGLAFSLCAGTAMGAPPKRPPVSSEAQMAQRLKAQGDGYMDQYAYPEAYELYRQAYAAQPDPALVYNMARALQGMGDYVEALTRLEQFSREAPSAVKAKVPLLEDLLADVRAHVTTLVVRCDVRGARILVRERIVGLTGGEVSVRVAAGPGAVEILADGYEPFRRSLVLPAGDHLVLEAKLSLRRQSGRIVMHVDPAGAMVDVDRLPLGPAPLDARIMPGTHTLWVRKRGYAEQRAQVSVAPGETRRVELKLDRKLVSQWWFWTGAALAVTGAIVLTVVLVSERPAGQGESFSPAQIRAPLTF